MQHSIQLGTLFLAVSSLFAPAARAQAAGPVVYALEATSSFSEGCYAPCLCPIFFGGTIDGTFTLNYVSSDPAGFDHYAVDNVQWTVGVAGSTRQVTGTGEYVLGGQVALQERLVLDLAVNGAPPEHFDSGLVPAQGSFPRIEIPVSKNGMYCYDTVYAVSAAPLRAGTPFCAGDGSGTACPCGNAGLVDRGCANSIEPAGARLTGTGTASLSNDTVVLVGQGTPNGPVLYFQGTQRANGGAGLVFGDGLRCVAGSLARLGIVPATAGESHVPAPLDPPLSLMGGIVAPGVFRYQAWYRNAAAFCTPSTFNLTNGFEIAWTM